MVGGAALLAIGTVLAGVLNLRALLIPTHTAVFSGRIELTSPQYPVEFHLPTGTHVRKCTFVWIKRESAATGASPPDLADRSTSDVMTSGSLLTTVGEIPLLGYEDQHSVTIFPDEERLERDGPSALVKSAPARAGDGVVVTKLTLVFPLPVTLLSVRLSDAAACK